MNRIKISFCGDVLSLKTQNDAIMAARGKYDYSGYLSNLRPYLESSDYVIANLETPLLKEEHYSHVTTLDIRFATPDTILKEIRAAGIHFLSTANNHCLDNGVQGIDETLNCLDDYAINHSGTYRTSEEHNTLFIKEIKGQKIAVICCTYGTNSEHNGVMLSDETYDKVDITKRQNKQRTFKFDPNTSESKVGTYLTDDVSPAAIGNTKHQVLLQQIIEKVRHAKTIADIVVCFPHLGGQYNPAPGEYTRHIVNLLKDAGADLIVVNHPHTSLRCEQLDNGIYCAYALGNLASTPNVGFFLPNTLSEYGIILHTIWVENRLYKITFNVVKSVVELDGITRVRNVYDIYQGLTNKTERERLMIDVEAVVNRFRGTATSSLPQQEYSLCHR